MSGFIQGEARHQTTLFPEALDDYISEENPIRVIDAFVDSGRISCAIPDQLPTHERVTRSCVLIIGRTKISDNACGVARIEAPDRSEEHTSELQSPDPLV